MTCLHTNVVTGPRISLQYGSAMSDLCADCGAWRTTHHAPGRWRPAAELLVEDVTRSCEWHPAANRAAHGDDVWHADATLSIGAGNPNWHVCQACSELPTFKRLRKRVALKGTP